MKRTEYRVRQFASHIALRIVKHRNGYVLHKKYNDRRRVSGVFRSMAGVERGLERLLNEPEKIIEWSEVWQGDENR